MIETLYTRYVHGSYPVKVVTQEDQETFELGLPEGIQRFLTARDLIQAIYDYTGDIAPRRISFRSYFRLAKVSDPEMTVLKLLELPEPRQRKLGIDLAKRGGEVRKLFFAGFGRRVAASGYDPEEVLQEVYRGLLARNQGICPWDKEKSSFGHYVHMVIECVVLNYHRKYSRRDELEQVGLPSFNSEGQWEMGDAAMSATQQAPNSLEHIELEEAQGSLSDWLDSHKDTRKFNISLSRDLLPLVMKGFSRMEIASSLKLTPGEVSRALSDLRRHTKAWTEHQQQESCG